MRINPSIYGLVAEFTDQDVIVRAAERARAEGYRRMDAYTPLPIHGLIEALRFEDNRVPWLIFIGGLTGAAFGYGLQFFINVIDYPLNIGGRPYHSWPAFIPVTFECTVLFASLTAVMVLLGLNGLPRPHHPIFDTPNFELASQNRFFLCIEATDPKFDRAKTRQFLESLGPEAVTEIEQEP